MTLKTCSLLAFLTLAPVLVPSAGADPLPPGATVTTLPAMIESGTLLAFTAVPFSDAEFTGELNQAVFLESGGTLDFAYQLQDSSSFTDVAGLTVIDFLGSTLDVGTAHGTAPFSGGSIGASASRDSAGDAITFSFGATPLAPGETSDVFLIQTNATTFEQNGFISATGTNGVPIAGSAGMFDPIPPPATAAPEPVLLPLLGAALLGMAGVRWRRGIRARRPLPRVNSAAGAHR
jgi:hypothetical protein